ncbi:MAG: ABC transporter permease, partial [Acidimicrobiales bacterium]
FLGQSGLWVSPTTWRTVQNANRPDISVGPDDFQAVIAEAADGVDPSDLATRIDAGGIGDTSSLSTIDAANTLPGVAEQGATFNAIIGTTFFVVGLVVALFFALLTLERVGLYAVLKAFGTPSRTLVLGVAVQAFAVAVISFGVGALFTYLLSLGIPPDVPVQFTISRGVITLIGITITAILGGLVSLRRIISVDPAAAIGAGV